MKNMGQKITFEDALRKIEGKKEIEEGNKVFIDNIPGLKWTDKYKVDIPQDIVTLVDIAVTPFGSYVITRERQHKTYELTFNGFLLTEDIEGDDAAKRMAEEDYKKRLLKALGL